MNQGYTTPCEWMYQELNNSKQNLTLLSEFFGISATTTTSLFVDVPTPSYSSTSSSSSGGSSTGFASPYTPTFDLSTFASPAQEETSFSSSVALGFPELQAC